MGARWKWLLLAGCAVALAWTVASTIDSLGFFSRPWYGYWDANNSRTGERWKTTFTYVRPYGAAARAGIRSGEAFDLRDQNLEARVALLTQPPTVQPVTLIARANGRVVTHVVSPSSTWDSASLFKLLLVIPATISALGFIVCAFFIALRRAGSLDGRLLAVGLIALSPLPANMQTVITPNPIVTLGFMAAVQLSGLLALALFVRLSANYGARSAWRRVVEGLAYVAIAGSAALYATEYYGILTARVDLGAFSWVNSSGFAFSQVVAAPLVLSTAIAGVVTSRRSERPRAAWLLLPLPIAVAFAVAANGLGIYLFGSWSWFAAVGSDILAGVVMLLGSLAVTYALLKRRVLDFEFVLSRALVLAIVSVIVVAAFVLLEWLLGTVLSDVSHATGLLANGALALVLGLSLRYIHARVDAFIDAVVFRKRHDDARALLDFSTEAAFVTEPSTLLDLTIEKLRRHTDARSAALFLDGTGAFASVRSFGNGIPASIDENDGAILALKARHKPIDPHHCDSAVPAALAIPMSSRGRLVGLLLLGERAGGEAYAPDEIESISQFAHGVSAAIDALDANTRDGDIRSRLDELKGMLLTLTASGHLGASSSTGSRP